MRFAFLLFAVLVVTAVPSRAAPAPTPLAVATAIEEGRYDQARLMIARMVEAGTNQPAVDRLTADLMFEEGKNAEALSLYAKLLVATPGQGGLCERAAIAAMRLSHLDEAENYLDCAVNAPQSSWRAWNARGVLADWKRDWTAAASAYEQALARDQNNASVLNNIGFSSLLQGDWKGAVGFFERAAARSPDNKRMRNNLELARMALSQDLPRRLPNESDGEWAARLNDAGMVARILGDRERAIAAFTRAIEANGSWFERAANNLEAVRHP